MMKPRNRREKKLVSEALRLLETANLSEMSHLTTGGSGASPIQRGLQGSWMGKSDAADMANSICAPGGAGNPKLNGVEYVSIAWTGQGSGPDVVLAPKTQALDPSSFDPSTWIAMELKTGTGNWGGTAGNNRDLQNLITQFSKSGGTASSTWTSIYNNPTWPAIKSALTNPSGTWDQGFINNLVECTWSGAPAIADVQAALSTSTPICGDYAICFSVGSNYMGISFGGLKINNFNDGDDPTASASGSKKFKLTGPGGSVGTFNIQKGLQAVSKVKFKQADADFVADCVLTAHPNAWPNWDVACQGAGLSGSQWDKATIAAFCMYGATTPYSGDPETIYGANHWACNSKTAQEVKDWHARSIPSYSRTGSGMGLVFAILSFCFGVPYVPVNRRSEAWVQQSLVDQTKTFATWMGQGNTL